MLILSSQGGIAVKKTQLIEHSKNYMDMLAQGVDPISKMKIEMDSVALQPRMQKCFAFVAEIFDELIKNNGFIALDPEDANRYEVVEKKSSFSLSKEQIHRISVSSRPITPNAFLNHINRVVDGKRMEKLSSKSMNAWLLSQGFITESKEPTTINRTIRRPSNRSSEIGIQEQESVDPKTGELKKQMVFTLQAQAYLLAHLDDIAACQQRSD